MDERGGEREGEGERVGKACLKLNAGVLAFTGGADTAAVGLWELIKY